MTAEQLKASILQMAIEGKLVPQRDDEPAVDIEAVEPEEVPFAIPEKWKWVRLSDVGEKLQYGYTASAQTSGKVKLLRITDITERGVSWDSVPFCAIDEEDTHKFKLQANDILIARTGGTIGKSFRIDSINCLSVFASYLIRVRVLSHLIFPEYVQLYLGCPWYWEQLRDKSRGTGQPNVNAKSLGQLLIPLPPLAEQRRIVARLNEILPLIEEYGKAHSTLKNTEQALPDQLRASLLQEAIQGKLVPQLDDEPAVDMAGEEPDEVPFAIPEKWKWVRLGDICQVKGGKRIPAGRKLTTNNTGHKYLRVSDMKDNGVDPKGILYVEQDIYEQIKKYTISYKDVYITVAGTIGRVGIIPKELDNINLTENADKLVLNFALVNQFWLVRALSCEFVQYQIREVTTKVGQPKLAIKRIENLLLPLPPLAEQRRIVARLEELLPHVDAIAGLR